MLFRSIPSKVDSTGWTLNRDSGAIYAADGTWLGSLAFPNLPPVGEYGKDWDVHFEGPLDLWLT